MLLLKIVLFCIIAITVVQALFLRLEKWTSALQQVYVRAAKEQGQDSSRWETPRMRLVAKIGVIFIGVTIILMSLSLLFG